MDFALAHKPRQEAGVRARQAEGDTGLLYAGGSHRDFALPFWRDMASADLGMRGYRMATHGAPPCTPVAGSQLQSHWKLPWKGLLSSHVLWARRWLKQPTA